MARTWRQRHHTICAPLSRYVDIPDLLFEAGRLGRVSGCGYFVYPDSASTPVDDPDVVELAIAESKRKGIERRIVDDVEIVERLVLAMVAEAAVLVAEGVVRHPGDVDVAMIHGFGFPRHTGGPLWWASGLESNCLSRGLQRLTEVSGEPVPHDLIAEMLRKVRHDG